MSKLLLHIIILCCATVSIVGQQQESHVTNGKTRVSEDKPTVYLSVERMDKEKVWLRMNNNTIWSISVRTFTFYFNREPGISLINGKSVFALPGNKEIDSLHYYIEKELRAPSNLRVPEVGYPDSSNISWIPAKGSIFFSIPIEQLQRGLMIYIPFHYEWELNEQLIFNNEPEHRVYFRGVDLPAKIR